jgi:hypothetical protein
MCGRVYQTYTDEELYFQYLNKRPLTLLQFMPVYNLCPTQNSPVLRLVGRERQFDGMRWQLVPNWEPAFSTKLSTQLEERDGVQQSAVRGSHNQPALRGSDQQLLRNEGRRATKRPLKVHLAKQDHHERGVWFGFTAKRAIKPPQPLH